MSRPSSPDQRAVRDDLRDDLLDGLLDDPRSVVRLRILRAARQVIAERGLTVSIEEIAEAAGMGRRTLFRHFDSHEELLAGALSSALDWYDKRVGEAMLADKPLEAWLVDLVGRLHEIHRSAGRGLWQLAAMSDDELSPQLAEVNRRRREGRRRTTKAIAEAAWRRADGHGPCPTAVTDACALTISSFATHSMVDDYGREPAAIARCTASLLAALLRELVSERTARARKPS